MITEKNDGSGDVFDILQYRAVKNTSVVLCRAVDLNPVAYSRSAGNF